MSAHHWREGEQPVATGGHSCTYATESIIPRYLAYLATAQDFQISKRKAAKGAKVIEVAPVDLARVEIPAPSIVPQRKVVDILDRFDSLTASLTDGLPAEIEARRQQYEYYRDRLLDFPRKAGDTSSMFCILDIGSMSTQTLSVTMAFPSMPRGCISRRGGRRFVPSQKNMRKIERRLSLPNRSNGTRKSAGKLTISRGADGAEAGVGKMIGWIYRVELAVCNLNRSAVCFVMADAARNVPKYVRIGTAHLYTLAFGCQLIFDQPEIRRRSGSSNSDFPLGS